MKEYLQTQNQSGRIGRTERISIALTTEEYRNWKSTSTSATVSEFIRTAVNEYIKIQANGRQQTTLDLILDQQKMFHQILNRMNEQQKRLEDQKQQLERFEADLLDISAAMAKFDIIVPVERNGEYVWEIQKK